jgi:hypothetical protein
MPKSSKKRHDRRRKTVWASRNKLLSCQSTLDNIINGFEAANVTGKQHNTQLSTSLLLPSNFNYSKMYRCVDESCLTSVLGQESAVIGRGSFGTCVIKIFSGIPVVVKQIHRRTLKQRHTLQEAHLLQVHNYLILNLQYVLFKLPPHDISYSVQHYSFAPDIPT